MKQMSDEAAYAVRFLTVGAVLFVAGLVVSYGLAHIGEPQSKWLWCDLLKVCL